MNGRPLVNAPPWFVPVDASAAVHAIEHSDPPLPQLRGAMFGPPVAISARESILNQIGAADDRVNGARVYNRAEVGGYLLAAPAHPTVIVTATDAVTESGPNHCKLGPLSEVHAGELKVVGCWHSHPHCDLIPSENDLRLIEAALVCTPRSQRAEGWVVELIVGPRDHSWEVAGWLGRWLGGDWRAGAKVEPVPVELVP